MMRSGRILLAAGVSALVVWFAAAVGPAGASPWPNVNWTGFLPALPTPSTTQPGAVPGCRKASIACIRTEIRRLRSVRDGFGCDHRAVFASTYLELTKGLLAKLRADPHFFRFPRYLYREDALFADVYFRTVRAWERGQPVPGAWTVAFQQADSGQVNGAQDMLMGINAHVQNDMPFVLAALGLRTRNGTSRKVDHDAFNQVLNEAYQPVVDSVSKRYDPIVAVTNSSLTPLDDAAGLELVRGWREAVWRNAERLINAPSASERDAFAQQIGANATAWANSIAAFQTPNYRASRDAYCHAQLGR